MFFDWPRRTVAGILMDAGLAEIFDSHGDVAGLALTTSRSHREQLRFLAKKYGRTGDPDLDIMIWKALAALLGDYHEDQDLGPLIRKTLRGHRGLRSGRPRS